ncbi:helix-turn-helix transcriptional regulator [Xanthomonas melonis]|nr:helix-turn-helix transcriptional regulator [Xanthomonas melonis]
MSGWRIDCWSHSAIAAMATKTIYDGQYRELIYQLRARRERLGLSQGEVARRLSWPQQRLSAIEAGARRLDILEFVLLTRALGMTVAASTRLLFPKEG